MPKRALVVVAGFVGLGLFGALGCGGDGGQSTTDDVDATTDAGELDAATTGDALGGDAAADGRADLGDTAPVGDGGTTAFRCKRGLAYGHDSVADLRALRPGISWWYDWSPTPEDPSLTAALGSLAIEFAPMVWGGSFVDADVKAKIPAGSKVLLGFNEPNFDAQANLTPTQAAALWPRLEAIAAAKGLQLVSPAVNYCSGACNVTDPYDWLDQFFKACPGCKVDAVAVHWYNCDKVSLMGKIGKFETQFGRPIWLTEFACAYGGDTSVASQEAYMKEALAALEADPKVQRYAWFTG